MTSIDTILHDAYLAGKEDALNEILNFVGYVDELPEYAQEQLDKVHNERLAIRHEEDE